MEPPTPTPELFLPMSIGSLPETMRFLVQYRRPEPFSSLTQSRSGSQNGPGSSTTTPHPGTCRCPARSCFAPAHLPAGAREPLRQNAAPRTGADDEHVDAVLVAV